MSGRRNRRGNAAVVALSLSSMLGFGALAVDVGMQRVADAQVQAAIEAGALGGAAYLERTVSSMTTAREMAVTLANENSVLGGWELELAEVEVGVWDGTTFTAHDPADLDPDDAVVMEINALRIETGHDGLGTVLANAAFGSGQMTTANVALAMRQANRGRARSVPCYLPLAIPDCIYADWLDGTLPASNPAPIRFRMSNDIEDNVGWGNPFSSDYGSDDIKAAFQNEGCNDESIAVDDDMHVKNGQNNTVVKFLGEALNGDVSGFAVDSWDDSIADRPSQDGVEANCETGEDWNGTECVNAGKKDGSMISATRWTNAKPVIQGPVALVKPATCDNTKFTGTMPISGFAWAMVYDAQDSGSTKNIWVQLDFINEHDMGGDIDDDSLGNITGFEKPQLVNL